MKYLHVPLGKRPLNPITGGLPLTLDEAWVFVAMDFIDTPQGTLMTWGGDSDCPNYEDHDPATGECLCWNGAMSAASYGSKWRLAEDGPFEWWPITEAQRGS